MHGYAVFAAPVVVHASLSSSTQRSTCSDPAGHFGHMVKCARIWRPVARCRNASRIAFAAPVGGRAWLSRFCFVRPVHRE